MAEEGSLSSDESASRIDERLQLAFAVCALAVRLLSEGIFDLLMIVPSKETPAWFFKAIQYGQ
jgi:hypothetical protein